MKTLTIISLTLFSFLTLAHESDHLWSTDKKAFEYTKNKIKNGITKDFIIPNESTLVPIDEQYFAEMLKKFSGAESIDLNGQSVIISERKSKEGMDNAREFLKAEYTRLGYETELIPFRSFFNKGANFVATKRGLDSSKVLLVTAHIDSVGNAGANDDGTGSIGSLAIAKALAPYTFKYDLQFIGFDKEESGLVGSKAYVKALSSQERNRILGVINFEMMGTNSKKDGRFHIIDCDRSESTFLTHTMDQIISFHKIELTKVPGCTTRSDHASFWNANIPAIVISENFFGGDSDRCYHRSCDRFDERLDFEYMEKITTAVSSTVYSLLTK